MSGIEAVGLALGLWPVVASVAMMVKEAKHGVAERQLAMNIAVIERIFKQSIQKLLQGDEGLSERDRIGLISGEEDMWKNPEFIARLQKRLDPEMFEILQLEAEQIREILINLKKKIETKEADSVSLPALSP